MAWVEPLRLPVLLARLMLLLAQSPSVAVAVSRSGFALLAQLLGTKAATDHAAMALCHACVKTKNVVLMAQQILRGGGIHSLEQATEVGSAVARQCVASIFSTLAVVAPKTFVTSRTMLETLSTMHEWGKRCPVQQLTGGEAARVTFQQQVALALWARGSAGPDQIARCHGGPPPTPSPPRERRSRDLKPPHAIL